MPPFTWPPADPIQAALYLVLAPIVLLACLVSIALAFQVLMWIVAYAILIGISIALPIRTAYRRIRNRPENIRRY